MTSKIIPEGHEAKLFWMSLPGSPVESIFNGRKLVIEFDKETLEFPKISLWERRDCEQYIMVLVAHRGADRVWFESNDFETLQTTSQLWAFSIVNWAITSGNMSSLYKEMEGSNDEMEIDIDELITEIEEFLKECKGEDNEFN